MGGTKSDFAQKLLHDLRLRKERMAATQYPDAHRNSRKTLEGPRETKTMGTNGSKIGRQNKSPYTSKKSPSTVHTNNQIVPYASSHHSRQKGDFSMALAYAFDEGGKLKSVDFTGNDAMMNLLRQVTKRSVQSSSNMPWQTPNQFPTLTHLHINEIAKGAQKLNQILRACSSDQNIDKFSTKMGSELWKGAIELQKSLKMLVSLQEASESMASSQRKSRLKLLEDGEDSEDDSPVSTEKQKHIERPVFSFDKSPRNKASVSRPTTTAMQPKPMALTYLKDVPNSKPGKLDSNATKYTYKNSGNYRPALQSSRGTNSLVKHDTGKIPNVIAKLMGLEELAQNINKRAAAGSQSISKQRSGEPVSTRKTYRSQGNTEVKIEYTNNANQGGIQNAVPGTKVTHQTEPQTETYMVTYNYSYKTIADSPNPRWNREGEEAIKKNIDESKEVIYTINELKSQVTQINEYNKNQRDIKKEIGVTRQMRHNNKETLQRMVEVRNQSSEAANKLKARANSNWNFKETEGRGANKPALQQEKQKRELELQQLQVFSGYQTQRYKVKPDNIKQQVADKSEKERREGKSKISKSPQNMANVAKKLVKQQPRKQRDQAKGNDEKANTLEVLKVSAVKDQNDDSVSHSCSISSDAKHKNSLSQKSEQDFSPTKPVQTAQQLEVKPVHVSDKNIIGRKLQKFGTAPVKIKEVMPRTEKSISKSAMTLKTQKPVLQKRVDKMISENGKPRPQAYEHVETTISQRSNELQGPKIASTLPLSNKERDGNGSSVFTVQNDQQLIPDEAQVPKLQTTATGNLTNNRNESDSLLAAQTNFSSIAKQDPLTEDEMYLKQKLITSNLFLSNAEALFKLNIPINVLNCSSDQINPERGNKLILDCAYEVLKRKGMKKVISLYPHTKIISSQMRISTLDDLVRQLHKDLETLKSHGKNGRGNYDDAIFLLKLLERDIQYKEMDLNCMWDLGWNQMTFAYVETDEVTRQIEHEMLEELMVEIEKDCMFTSNPIQ